MVIGERKEKKRSTLVVEIGSVNKWKHIQQQRQMQIQWQMQRLCTVFVQRGQYKDWNPRQWQSFCKQFDLKFEFVSISQNQAPTKMCFHPQLQGMVEIANRTLKA